MRSPSVSLLLALGAVVSAAPSLRSAPKVKEEVVPPRGWTKVGPVPEDRHVELRIGLPQPNFFELERHLYEVSDPAHERYGAHLSKEEVEALVAPHPESVNLVSEWLTAHGILEDEFVYLPGQDWVKLVVPIRTAETMLDTEYHVWVHDESGDTLVRTTSYSLPEHLHDHIDLVVPTTAFSRFRPEDTTVRLSEAVALTDPEAPPIQVPSALNGYVDASCNSSITITCLQQLYNIDYTPSAVNRSKVAVTAYLEQYASFSDLELFYEMQVPDAAAVHSSFDVVSINGGLNNQSTNATGIEANLDVQVAFGLTYPIPATFYTTGGRPPLNPYPPQDPNDNEPYLQWLEYMLTVPSLPQTISTSYGDLEETVPYSYAKRVCQDLAQLGARGVSLLYSSGDFGVGDSFNTTGECLNINGQNAFTPIFPATCPYITSVGGTTSVPEVAFYISSGGFSNYFPRPIYQEKAVPAFLATVTPGAYEGMYNSSGRGFPDVAAQSNYFDIIYQGVNISIGGTSAAAPTVNGIVTLLNDARLSQGLPPLGFLNPLLYTIGDNLNGTFNDITVGNNPGCNTTGFNATGGWDAVTGWGTLNFGKLVDIVLDYW